MELEGVHVFEGPYQMYSQGPYQWVHPFTPCTRGWNSLLPVELRKALHALCLITPGPVSEQFGERVVGTVIDMELLQHVSLQTKQ